MKATSRAQVTLEASALIACVAIGVAAMHFYVTRTVQGKNRQAADSISEQQ
jgi:ABC-type sulfate transport system permease component